MTPWSVRPSAGWSKAAARAARPSILQAPSRSEYSLWTWRCTAGAKASPSMGSRLDGPWKRSRSFRVSDYADIVAVILAILAAVAGGNLAVTAAPEKPRVGKRVVVRSTGQVGDTGHLYVYRQRGTTCAQSARAERHRGVLMARLPVDGSFDFEVFFVPRRTGLMMVCGYLYADTCDAAGQNCGPAVGLPPDAGFSRVRLRVRAPAPSRSASAATR